MCNFNDLPTLPTLARGARSLRSFALRSGGPLAPRQVRPLRAGAAGWIVIQPGWADDMDQSNM